MEWHTDLFRTLISVAAAIISIFALYNSSRFSKASLERAKVSAAIAEFNAKLAYRKNLLDWGTAVQDSICEAHTALQFVSEGDAELQKKIIACMGKLTAQIDRGRWLLPNNEHDKFGTNKQTAYTGSRQEALDALVGAYNVLTTQVTPVRSDRSKAISSLWTLRREFTSAVQDKIEPRILDAELSVLRDSVAR